MAYTKIATYVTNQLITAAHANTNWRDNINELWPFTAAGNIAYASTISTLAALAKGQAGQVLRAGASLPIYGSPISCYGTCARQAVINTSSTSFVDISNATVDIVVPCTSTLVAFAALQGAETGEAGDESFWCWVLDNTVQPVSGKNARSVNYDAISIIGIKTGVQPGTRTCKLQHRTSGGKVITKNAFGIVLGFAE